MKGECFCTKDKDGQCPSCRSAILEMSQKIMGVLRKKVKMAMPLTEKAWFDLCAARGWNPEQFASNPQG